MADTHSTPVAEAARQSTSHAPVAVQRQPESPQAQGMGPIQRATNAISGGSPSTSPNAFGSMIENLPDSASRASALNQLQASYGNSYAGQVIQRKCQCGDTCEKCAAKNHAGEGEKKLQRQGGGVAGLMPDEAAQSMARSGEGAPLDAETRSLMESRFSTDFSDVRVHTDSEAEKSAKSVGAQAYTRGRDIYFGAGQYTPGSDAGRKLLAHELTHVVQQSTGAANQTATKLVLNTPGDTSEQEADRAAEAISSGRSFQVAGTSSANYQAKGAGGDKDDSKVRVKAPKPFKIPSEKLAGPADRAAVLTIYQDLAKSHQLADLHPGRAESTAWPQWERGRGKEVKEKLPSTLRDTCSPDHVVELQLGGADDARNLRLLGRDRNQTAGVRIWSEQVHPNKQPGVITEYAEVEAESPKGTDDCLKFDLPYWKGEQAGASERRRAKEGIEVQVGGAAVFIGYGESGNVVRASRFAIAGFELQQVKLDTEEPISGKIDATISAAVKSFVKERKTKVRFLIKDGVCELDPEFKVLKLYFPFLSDADLNLSLGPDGLSGVGKFKPTVPLLNRSEVQIKIESGKFSGGVKVPASDINLPIPGLKVTECSVELRLNENQFSATGVLAFSVGAFANARLEADADSSGFRVVGTVDFLIPGITAKGKVSYKDKKLTGQILLGKDKFKFPGVKSASLVIDISDGEIVGTGEVLLDIPGIKKGTLGFGVDKAGNYAITGLATLDIPGLKSAEIGLTYRDGDLEGLAKVGLDIPGLEGAGATFEIKYAKGIITGAGDFKYQKGKISGKVHAELTEKRKLTGNGELAYEVTPGLIAALGVELREDGTTKFSPELRFPDTIDLFKVHPIEKTLFSVGTQIPIFAIPLGPRSVGLVAEVGADLKARAGIGPGQIRKLTAKTNFDSAKPEAPLEFKGGGELYVPAFAELALSVHGGIGLSLAIASATGGIKLAGSVGLLGALTVGVEIVYQDNQFSVDGFAELSAQPVMKFSVSAYVSVEIDLLFTSIEVYSKEWNLASKEWGGGMKTGLRFPVHYVFGQPFNLSLSQVEFIAPDIDVIKAVKDLIFD